MNITETIVKMVQEVVPGIENEIKRVEQQLKEVQTGYNRALAELIEVNNHASIVKAWSTKEVSTIEAIKSQVNQSEVALEQDINKAREEIASIYTTIRSLNVEKINLESEVKELYAQRDSIAELESIKSALLKDMARLNDEATAKSKIVSGLNTEIERLTESKSKAESNYREANKELIESIALAQVETRERANQLNEQEKALDMKESDLKTVEARWKKLYEGKGAGFKI